MEYWKDDEVKLTKSENPAGYHVLSLVVGGKIVPFQTSVKYTAEYGSCFAEVVITVDYPDFTE
jgi:hypothetical protein